MTKTKKGASCPLSLVNSRAYAASARRKDRSIKARIESALNASALHFKRTGSCLYVTEAILSEGSGFDELEDFADFKDPGLLLPPGHTREELWVARCRSLKVEVTSLDDPSLLGEHGQTVQTSDAAPAVQTSPVQASSVQASSSQSPPIQATPIQSPHLQTTPIQSPHLQAPPIQSPPLQSPPIEALPIEAPLFQGPLFQEPSFRGPPAKRRRLEGPSFKASSLPLQTPPNLALQGIQRAGTSNNSGTINPMQLHNGMGSIDGGGLAHLATFQSDASRIIGNEANNLAFPTFERSSPDKEENCQTPDESLEEFDFDEWLQSEDVQEEATESNKEE